MALPSPSPSHVPTFFLLIDGSARVSGFDAPDGLHDVLFTAVRTGRRVETLAWNAPREVRRAIQHARSGQRHEFCGWQLGDFTFDGAVFPLAGADGSVAIAANDTSDTGEGQRYDPLTGLWNRHHFLQELERLEDSGTSGALAIVDLDRFASINDRAGHRAGDAVLCTVAERMRFLDGLGHWTARLGGDEFACFVFERDGSSDDERIVESLHQRLDVPFTIGDERVALRTTIGYARAPGDGSGLALLSAANVALASAKASARGSVVRYHRDLEGRILARGRIEADLSRAIERGEFEMFYQPVIDAKSGTVVATEALLRWNHPELGMLLPSSFLNVAEESDHVVNIGRWAMERACRDAVDIAREFGRALRLNVNISPRHVQSTALVDDVHSALSASGWHASLLQVEVTEQLLIEDVPAAASTLSSLRNTGVTVAIDDFGTGYNTLSYLKSYPVSCLKIDRAFVRDAESDDYSRAICRSVTALAESLDMSLIGEGVETDGQARFLEAIGCQELQGYHFGRPVNVAHFIDRYR